MQELDKTPALFKLEIDETAVLPEGSQTAEKDAGALVQTVEFELLPPVEIIDERRVAIYREIADIDERLELINARVDELNAEIDSLTNHADGLDYAIAVASGIIAGIIDSVWVGEFSLDSANKWGGEKVNNFIIKTAQRQGYKGDSLTGAVKFLEDRYPIAADKATADFGGGKQHHLRDFSHHPTPIGLLFSLLTQFTRKIYGTDVTGAFKVVPISDKEPIGKKLHKELIPYGLIGRNLPEKLMFGVVNWVFHMVSDMAGASGSIKAGSVGTGLPGPLVSLLKEISALPIFRRMNEDGYKEFSVWVSKLFNGTLLAKRDENGKIVEAVKFDLRTEIGVAHELGRQAVPVIVNECVVRGFYFIRRLFCELRDKNVRSISGLGEVDWRKTLPFKNRTVVRMLTISTGTFMAVDIADAAIRSGGFNHMCLLRINYIGVGRFVIAVGTDIKMGLEKSKKERECMMVRGMQLELLNAKMFYKQADMWIEAENTNRAIQEAYQALERAASEFMLTWDEIRDGSARRREYAGRITENDPSLAEKLLDILEWGV